MKTSNKTLSFPHLCLESNKIFNTNVGLSLFITNSLKHINHKQYYDKYVNSSLLCFFCKNEGKFISITKGYRNLCTNKICVSKSRSTYTINCIMYTNDCTYNEAEKILNDKIEKNKIICKNVSLQNTLNNSNYLKENSSWCIEFWIKKGYNEEEEAKIKLNKHQCDNVSKLYKHKKENPEKYLDINNTQLGYWIKKGFNEEEAKEKLKERQTTFSLEKCINKHGIEEGTKIWQTRQDKWQNTLNSKSDEEKLEINIKKVNNMTGYSKISQELFWTLSYKFKENNIVFQELSNKEIIIYNRDIKKIYKLDYVDFTHKKVIEFNGDYWHCNPLIYSANYYNTTKKQLSACIWAYDNIKHDYIKKLGYELLIVWESTYRKDKTKILNDCINFINN